MKLGSVYLASALAATMFVSPSNAQQTDWTQRVTMSAKGGHIVGNPLAKHKLTEYMSYTCNHCANFERESHAPLKDNYIKKGHINFEVRNLILNPIDLTAAMLARCGGRTKFFGNHQALLAQQATWVGEFQKTPADKMKTMNEGTVPQRLKKIAKASDLYGLMKKRGYSATQVDACLSSKPELDKILGMTKHATQNLKITGTPGFTINDKKIAKVHSWGSLKPKLATLPQ
ncbi:MAG: thioredoxin domain-containing protein [Parasphingorhabdus sp.]